MPPTLIEMPTLMIATGAAATIAVALSVGVLVYLSRRKKRAASRAGTPSVLVEQGAPSAVGSQPTPVPTETSVVKHEPETASAESPALQVETHLPPSNGSVQALEESAPVEPARADRVEAEAAEPTVAPETEGADNVPEWTGSDGLKAGSGAGSMRLPFALRRTRERFLARLRAVFAAGKQLEEICAGLEEALIEADVGVETSVKLIDAIRSRLERGADAEAAQQALKDEIVRLLKAVPEPAAGPAQPPLVVILVGVNGVGKTTTVAKLAAHFEAERGSVIVGAADTFRAAAVEQLEVWCQRAGVDLIKHRAGGDPAAVAFDTVKAAVARGVAVALIDTAGRLQTKTNLMEELKKIARVIGRELPGAPHETWLVLDATTGQNALSQAKLFSEAVRLTGVVLAKLDSSAKGGVVLGIADRLGLRVRFVGVGEELEDLRVFDAEEFAEGMFEAASKNEQIVTSAYPA